MKVKILIIGLLLFSEPLWAQIGEPSKKDAPPSQSRATGDVVPLPSIKNLPPPQAAGKKLFVQRCAICHLPALPSYTAYGPLLSGNLIMSLGETAAREQIKNGSTRMPGYQYTLNPDEIDLIISYLKTLEYAKKDGI